MIHLVSLSSAFDNQNWPLTLIRNLFMLIFSVCFMINKGLMNDKSFQFSKKLFIEHRLWLGNCGVFGGVSLMYESISQARIHFEDSFEINFCFFKRLTQYSANGGVIFIDGGSYSMNLTNSMFYNCSSSSNGGAIYFNSSYSNLRMICANRCSCGASKVGSFADLRASQVNQLEFLSLSICSPAISGYDSVFLNNGDQRVDNTNSSMNSAIQGSGIYINNPSSFSGEYCTFSNNTARDGVCIDIYTATGTISLLYTNIIQNSCPLLGVIFTSGPGLRMMMYCIFDLNQNVLFCVYGGSLEVSHSFISLTGALSVSNPVSIANNNSFSKRQTYQIQFFNSYYCNTDIPIRTIEATLGVTSQETPQRTYENCSEFYHTSDLKELSAIFSFRFFSQILILLIQ